METAPALLGGRLPSITLNETSVDAIRAGLAAHAELLMSLVDHYGGVLVTTSALKSPEDFDQCLAELISMTPEYPGGAPRKKVTPGDVFTSTEFEPNLPIPGHTELGYMPCQKPELISFFCEVAPVAGGMTPVVDMQEVLQRLPSSLVTRLAPGVLTSLNLPANDGPHLSLQRGAFVQARKTWSSIDSDPNAAARQIQAESPEEMEIEWKDGWLQPFIAMPAMQEHRCEQVWTGFFPLFHPSGATLQACFDLCMHNRSLQQVRTCLNVSFHYVLWAVANLLRHIPGVSTLVARWTGPGFLSCRLRGGGSMGFVDIFRILWAYNTLAVKWPWQAGQFVLLDNYRMGHMRTPYDRCERRRIYTAFGSRKCRKE
mmetsp:Transcript_90972/g.253191  ORF Transcript_90972/g.253191 Transcript_90972/m.253191 type:complete len:371 (+) Transcript_90972:37-1149(+)